ncbi:MAG: hypothetical protein JWM33_1755 [Caulobacteraceae bacterium]|nr:hypothetical protein [Caulobacteraceae bacterium]
MAKFIAWAMFALALMFAAPAAAAPAMWTASRDGATLVLFGSMHLLQPGLVWRTPAYDSAYAQARTVWFETDANPDPGRIQSLLSQRGVDPDHPLTAGLSRAGKAAIAPILAARGQTLADIDRYRPWAAALMLSVAPLQAKGYSVEQGADAVVTRQARGEAKPIATFETLDQQVDLFAGLSQKDAMQYLEDVVGGKGALRGDPISLEKAWMKGDVAGLEKDVVAPLRAKRPAIYQALLARRNQAWADRLDASVRQSGAGVQLVNVGALHMVGAEGLPALLAARGYRVTRVQ